MDTICIESIRDKVEREAAETGPIYTEYSCEDCGLGYTAFEAPKKRHCDNCYGDVGGEAFCAVCHGVFDCSHISHNPEASKVYAAYMAGVEE